MKKLLLATGLAVLAASALVVANQTATGPQPGAEAPGFTLQDSNGATHNLSDFRGKHVVLEWTNHQCPFVVKHYVNGDMQATQQWAKDNGIVWLSIVSSAPGKQGYVDGEAANKLREEQKHASTATLLDPTGQVGRLYGARTTPHMYIIDPQGKLIYVGAISSNRSANPADVKTARNHVRAALEEALAGKAVSVPATQPYGCSVKYPD